MKKAITVTILLMAITSSTKGHPPVDLVIFAGQSNAMGRKGDAAQYPADAEGLDVQIPFYWVTPEFGTSSEGWKTLCPQPGQFPAGHFGPEITFARELKRSGLNVAVFKFSRGNSSVFKLWKAPGEGRLYDQMVDEFRKAKELLEAQGHTVRVAGLVWIQGESDAVEGHADLYYDRLKALIEDLRIQVTQTPDLPVVLGLDEQHPWVKKFPQVIAAQERLAQEDPRIIRTSMIGLKKADISHLTPESVQQHGHRVFEGWQSLFHE